LIIPPGGSFVTVPVPARPNLIRNSGFWFAQVQDPTTATNRGSTTLRRIGPDGWAITNENADVTYQRIDTSSAPETGLAGRYYGRFLKITNAGKVMLTQAIEGADIQSTRGNTVRLQMRLKAPVGAATWRMGLLQLTSAGTVDTIPAFDTGTWISAWNADSTDPTLQAGNNVAYVAPNATSTENTTVVGNALQCAVTTDWQRFGGTFEVPANCKNLLVAIWSDADVAVNNGLFVAEASMTLGADIVQFSPLSYSEELRRCQRYIVKTFQVDVNPAQNTTALGSLRGITGKSGSSTSALFLPWRFPTELLYQGLADTNPYPSRGITRYNPQNTNTLARNVTVGIDMGAATSTVAGKNALVFQCAGIGGGGGSGVGDLCHIHMLIYGEL
jgi:hypothetical protein